jgi:monoamine oxidase
LSGFGVALHILKFNPFGKATKKGIRMKLDKTTGNNDLSTNSTDNIYDVVVVGGGISGMVAAYSLRHLNVLVLEKDERMGGRILSGSWDIYHYNTGAQFVTGENSNVGKFVDMLGVKRSSVDTNISIYFRGRIIHGNLFTFLFKLPISWRAKLSLIRSGIRLRLDLPTAAKDLNIMGLYPNRANINYTERITPGKLSGMDMESFGKMLDSYHPDVKELYRTMFSSLTSANVEQLSRVFATTFIFGSSDAPTLVEGGMSAITSAWEKEMAGRYITGASVNEVLTENGGVNILFERNGQRTIVRARRCIVSTPTPNVLRIVKQLPNVKRTALEKVNYGAFIVVTLFLEKRMADGIWVMPVQGKIFSTLLNPTYIPARSGIANQQGVLTLYSSDQNARKIWEMADNDIISLFVGDTLSIYPELSGKVMGGVVHRWSLGLPRWDPGYLYSVRTLKEPVGPIHFCGDYTSIPCLDSATSSGMRAAKEVNETFGPGF